MTEQQFTAMLEEMAQAQIKRLQERTHVIRARVQGAGLPWETVFHFAVPHDLRTVSRAIGNIELDYIEAYLNLPKCHNGCSGLHTENQCVSCGKALCEFCKYGSRVTHKIEICKACWEQGK